MYVLPVFKEGEIRIPGYIQRVGYNAGNTCSQMNQPNSINLVKTNSVTCRVQKLGRVQKQQEMSFEKRQNKISSNESHVTPGNLEIPCSSNSSVLTGRHSKGKNEVAK